MGGTSCDVCVVEAGAVRETAGREVGGRPLALAMVDIHTVGAGGGSVAWRDPGGALRVGPRSAGADARTGVLRARRRGADGDRREPPARPPRHATRRWPAGSRSTATRRSARSRALAAELGLDLLACAEGIVRVADAEMVRALRVMTVEQGIDPRRFALLAFGGAGPLHAAAIADELGMTTILCPRASGVLSALGLAAADRRASEQRTVLLAGDGADRRGAGGGARRAGRRGARDAGRGERRRRRSRSRSPTTCATAARPTS